MPEYRQRLIGAWTGLVALQHGTWEETSAALDDWPDRVTALRRDGKRDSVNRHGPLLEASMNKGLRRFGAGVAIMFAIAASPAAGPLSEPADKETAVAAVASGPLDGMVYVGKIGLKGKLDLDDELHFAAGQFWSSNCVACGYQPGAYWTRIVDDNIHFQGVLKSVDRGKLEYSGRVVDGRVDVSIHWTQHRWYWSIDRDLAFVGTLAKNFKPTEPGAEGARQCQPL